MTQIQRQYLMQKTLLFKKKWLIKQRDQQIEDCYILNGDNPLGSGTFGMVMMGVNRVTRQERAIKKIPKAKVSDPKEFMRQIQILQTLDHPNIIKLYEIFQDKRFIYLVMELCTGGELFDKILEVGHFSEAKAQTIFREIMLAVSYCHQSGVAHRDLKPQNFMLLNKSADSPIKIIDFGLSFQFNKGETIKKEMTTVVGTVICLLVLLHGPGDNVRQVRPVLRHLVGRSDPLHPAFGSAPLRRLERLGNPAEGEGRKLRLQNPRIQKGDSRRQGPHLQNDPQGHLQATHRHPDPRAPLDEAQQHPRHRHHQLLQLQGFCTVCQAQKISADIHRHSVELVGYFKSLDDFQAAGLKRGRSAYQRGSGEGHQRSRHFSCLDLESHHGSRH